MTKRDMVWIGVGIVVAAATYVGAVFVIGWLRGDEGGIRVKNGGSILIFTESGAGFDDIGGDWDSKLEARKTCFDLYVNTTPPCATPVLRGVKRVTVQDISGARHDIRMFGRKLGTVLSGSWQLGSDRRLRTTNTLLRAVNVSARKGSNTLSCAFGDDDPDNADEIVLDARNATCN